MAVNVRLVTVTETRPTPDAQLISDIGTGGANPLLAHAMFTWWTPEWWDALLRQPERQTWIAENVVGGGPNRVVTPAAFFHTIRQTDRARNPIIWSETMLHSRLYDAGVDADGDPVVGPIAEEAYAKLIKAAMNYWKAQGVLRSYYRVPDKLWTRLQAMYADTRFNLGLTITNAPARDAAGLWHVEVLWT